MGLGCGVGRGRRDAKHGQAPERVAAHHHVHAAVALNPAPFGPARTGPARTAPARIAAEACGVPCAVASGLGPVEGGEGEDAVVLAVQRHLLVHPRAQEVRLRR